MTLTDDDIARGLELCGRAPKEIAMVTLGMYSDEEVPSGDSSDFYVYARTLLPAALAELKRWRPAIEAAKAWRARMGDGTDSPLAAAIDAAIAQEPKP